MAVKARESITISRIIDILSVTRYYLLQSSTSAAPGKPTANPPGGDWATTEPSYTAESTNTLYFVDCTIFTNDTFSYSEVSKSSSYEAAKEAYNKANDAQNRITNAETKIESNSEQISLRATAESLDTTNKSLESLEASLDIQAKAIESLVRDGKGNSLLTQDSNGWHFDIEKYIDENVRKTDIDRLDEDLSDALKGLSELKTKTAYITIGSGDIGEPYIELGDSESDFKVRITNEQIQFIQLIRDSDRNIIGQVIPAYITNRKLMIENAEVHKELNFGQFTWTTRANGNMGLIWEANS